MSCYHKFFKERFPYKNYYRLRFMLLEPGGFITPHKDTDTNKLSPINMALNHPKGCLMKMSGHEGLCTIQSRKSHNVRRW